MTILEKLGVALAFWSFLLVMCNPFLADKVLKYIAVACAIGSTICFVLS